MWQKDRSADAAGRLENLKELVRSMEEFENLAGFLEHISLVMDTDRGEGEDAVNIMTLHSAKGLEFDTVFLPGWEEGLFPQPAHARRAGPRRARGGAPPRPCRPHARAQARQDLSSPPTAAPTACGHTNIPSRFLDELPEAHVEVTESKGGVRRPAWRGYGASRFDEMTAFGSNYGTPGWQRAQANKRPRRIFRDRRAALRREAASATTRSTTSTRSTTTMAWTVARDVAARPARRSRQGGGASAARRSPSRASWWRNRPARSSAFAVGDRVFHQKFGNGNVVAVDGNKLTIAFDKAGEKRVVDSFVERV